MQLQLETIAICNAACVFCPYPTMKRQRGTMDMGLFRKIVDEAATIPMIEDITLTGLGEPLLDKFLIERIGYIRGTVNAMTSITVYTNGTYLTEEKARQLSEAGISILYVSLNALDARRRKAIMKLDDFDVVVPQIEKAIEIFGNAGKGQKLVVKGIVSKDLMEHGEPELFEERWGGSWNNGGRAFLHMEGNWAGATYPVRVTPQTACHRAIGEIMVLWDGRVSICCFDGEGEVIMGDLNTQGIREIYNGEKAWEFRNAHMEGRRGELPLCAQCTAI
jgi:sulfatase maturation enzyme AslB (radical SAM superfamily)